MSHELWPIASEKQKEFLIKKVGWVVDLTRNCQNTPFILYKIQRDFYQFKSLKIHHAYMDG